MLPTRESIKSYHIYTYTFLDDLSCIVSPYDYFANDQKENIDDAIYLIKERFKEYGWEGDGAIGIIWLPPFVDTGIEDTWGTYIWHVKQNNNGISFIACDVSLDFQRLRDQNEDIEILPERQGLIPISLIETCVNWYKEVINKTEHELRMSLAHLAKDQSPEIVTVIRDNLNTHYQGLLVRNLHEFFDECYLQFLIEAVDAGNPNKIKILKSKVKLDTYSYIPDLDDKDTFDSVSANSWFTLKGLIKNMWDAYKWEPFKSKTNMLFKSIDYKPDEKHIHEIKKHIILRNCVQHHEGCLDRDSLSQLGCDKVQMQGDKTIYHIDAWKPITFSEHEIYTFCGILRMFIDNFHDYVKRRVPTIHYMSRPNKAVL